MERKLRRDEKLREKQLQSVSFSFHACSLGFWKKSLGFILFYFQLIVNFILYKGP